MTFPSRAGSITLLSGAAAALGQAPFHLWPIALFGFACLAGVVSNSHRPMRDGWLGGLGYFMVSLHWIVQPFLVDVVRHGWMAPFALVFLAGGLALFWGVAGWISARTRLPALGWAIALAGAELARGYLLTGFPWALPAYIWTDTWVRVSAADIGPFGLTLTTLVIAALPFTFRRVWPGLALSVVGLAILFGSNIPGPQAKSILGTVRIVQPNAPQHEKWDPEKAQIFVDRQIGFTGELNEGVGLIVWPETAIPYRLDIAAPVLGRIAHAADGAAVVLGANRVADGRYHNSLVVVGSNGLAGEVYDKVHLVPFGEYIPMGQLAEYLGLQSFAARDGYGFSPGDGVRLIDTPLGLALPLICYEAIFPSHGRSAERPEYLLQITNDAWFGTFSGPYQHLDQARFRAAEQGLAMVRAANTGISAVIGTKGEIRDSLPLGETGYLDAELPAPLAPTIYAQTGDWPAIIIILVTLAALLLARLSNAIANWRTTS